MAKSRILNIVATECLPDTEAKFNKWYDEVHIPMFMKFKGVKKVTRYRLIGDNKDRPKYLAIYEFDTKEDLAALPGSPEFQAAITEMQETWKGKMFDLKWASSYEPLKTFES